MEAKTYVECPKICDEIRLNYYTDDMKKDLYLCMFAVKAMNKKKNRGAICSDKGIHGNCFIYYKKFI